MSQQTVIPLFPLPLVVFPGQILPLHIFEDRYKQMVEDCGFEADGSIGEPSRPFGISLAHTQADAEPSSPSQQPVEEIGCSVVVARVARRYPDGRLDIITRAQRRYDMLDVFDDRPYMTASVIFFEDEEATVDAALSQAAGERFGQLMELAGEARSDRDKEGGNGGGGGSDPGPDRGSFAMAANAGLDPPRKQRVLEMRSENERLQFLIDHLDDVLPVLRNKVELQKRVKSNGHPRN